MSVWVVTDRLTATVVHAYTSDAPVEWPGMEFGTHNHSREPEAIPPVVGKRVTKQQFIDLLGTPAVVAILTMAKTDTAVEAWVKRLDLVTPDPDGTSVDLTDPRTVDAVTALGASLLAAGVVDASWISGVLSGNGL